MPQIRPKYEIAIKQRIYFRSPNFCQRIRTVKIFRVSQERFRLNTKKYEQVILTICRIVRLRIGALILPLGKAVRVSD
jgi:hypothetical protein